MATFQVKADLPQSVQAEIDRISAIASAQRTTPEANFLSARADYIYNQVNLRDEDDLILIAQGRTVPSGMSGFAYGATFIDTDSSVVYRNVGDSTTCRFVSITGTLTLSGAGAPVDYTDGDPVATGEGYAPAGSTYADTETGDLYVNTGTTAEPTWSELALVA